MSPKGRGSSGEVTGKPYDFGLMVKTHLASSTVGATGDIIVPEPSDHHYSGDLPNSPSPSQPMGGNQLRSLSLPALDDIHTALQFFRTWRKRRLFLTAIFKMRVNSKVKEDELLEAHLYVTRFAVRVLTVFGKN